MARKTVPFTQWLKEVARRPLGDTYVGVPVADAMEKLGVSKQRVHQLIDNNTLDAIEVTTKKGAVAIILVTNASLDFYLTHRTRYAHDGRFTLESTTLT